MVEQLGHTCPGPSKEMQSAVDWPTGVMTQRYLGCCGSPSPEDGPSHKTLFMQ